MIGKEHVKRATREGMMAATRAEETRNGFSPNTSQ
jgi:hypothetical protein